VATDDDIDDWSARVAGRGDAAGPPDGVHELRKAIRRADEDTARTGAGDRVGLARLLRRLENEGLLERAAPVTAPSVSGPRRAPLWLAAVASVALAVVGLKLLMPSIEPGPGEPPPPLPPVETSRGFAGVVKQVVPDPEVAAAEVERELAGLGLAPRRAPAAGRVIIELDVTPDRLDAFHGWVTPRGGRATVPGRYRVILEPAS
jgi:hypothetical protein